MLRKIKSRISKITKNEKGSVSMYFIIFMVFFLPFAYWIGVNLPLKYEATYTVKQMTSNTADSMISRLDPGSLAKGKVQVDLVEASIVAKSMIRQTLNTDAEGNPSGEGILKERVPIFGPMTVVELENLPRNGETGEYILPLDVGVHIYVVNNPSTIIRVEGLLPIDNTSVIVRANIPVENGGLLGGRAVITRTGLSEAQIHTGGAS